MQRENSSGNYSTLVLTAQNTRFLELLGPPLDPVYQNMHGHFEVKSGVY